MNATESPETGEGWASVPRAFLGVGSNIRPEENILALVRVLLALPTTEIIDISTFYRTPPMSAPGEPSGHRDQDSDYLNGVLEIGTTLGPEALQKVLEGVELGLGRVRTEDKFAPRSMDIDILLYLPGQESSIDGQKQSVETPPPHPEIFTRAFVAIPLAEIAPDLILPPDDTPMDQVVGRFSGPGGDPDREFSADLKQLLRTA